MKLNPLENGQVQDLAMPGRPVVAEIDFRGYAEITEIGERLRLSMEGLEFELWRGFLAADTERSWLGSNWRQEDYTSRYIRFFKQAGYWQRDNDDTEERALFREIETEIAAKGYRQDIPWGELADIVEGSDPEFSERLNYAETRWFEIQP